LMIVNKPLIFSRRPAMRHDRKKRGRAEEGKAEGIIRACPYLTFIHRHPLDIMNSSLNALRVIVNKETVYSEIFSPFAKKIDENPLLQRFLQSLLFPRFPIGLALVTENRSRYTKEFLSNIKKMDTESYINIKYEDLCHHPTNTMKSVFDHLNIKITNINRFEDFIQPRNLRYSPEIYTMSNYIMNRFKDYCKHFDYH
jgi:hypothetical protein